MPTVMIGADDVMTFCDGLLPQQVPWLPAPNILSFLVTTGEAATHPEVALARIARLAPGTAPTDVNVHLRGALPRPLLVGENITISVSDYAKVHGYQLKTAPLRARGLEADSHEVPAPGELVLHARQAFTVHHGPYELKFFERVPFEDVQQTMAAVTHGLVAIGPNVNITPRFVWRREVRKGRLASFHGDGLQMKTFRNLQINRTSVRVVFDLQRLEGFALYGQTEEVSRESEPDAWREVMAGFAALGFGTPSTVYRHLSDRILRIELPKG